MSLRTWVTEHRCAAGGWRRGRTKDCESCAAVRSEKGKRAKRAGES